MIIASSNDDKVVACREAFQTIFGRATVYGHHSQGKSIAAQPVGFENAELAAKERINSLRSNEAFVDKVIVAVENFIVELYKNQLSLCWIMKNPKILLFVSTLYRWFDVGLLMLSNPSQNISLKTFTQMTSIPLPIINSLQMDTPPDYDKRGTGFAVTVGAAMSRNLDVSSDVRSANELLNHF